MDRYSRHIILSEIGYEGQDKLSNARVLVVGAGGLGCPVLQYLTAAGIGTLGIIDFDVVELSNLQRQVLFGLSSIGQNKAKAAKKRLTDLNNNITIRAYPEKLTYQNAIGLFSQYDIIVDGTDNFETRYLINDACIITNKPLVFGAIYKFEGHVSVFNYKNGPSYRCLFPEDSQKNTALNCAEIGVLGVIPGILGSMQANEVLKIVLELGNILSGTLLCYNALSASTYTISINRIESNFATVLKESNRFAEKQLSQPCNLEPFEVSIADVLHQKNIQFIDVRNAYERPKIDTIPVTSIPLHKIKNHISAIHPEKQNVFFCQSGLRSKVAVSILKKLNINNCFSIKEGALEIKAFIEKQKILLK